MRKRILFVLNSYGPASGAEYVLADFLKSTAEIDPVIVQIGPRTPNDAVFSGVVGPEDIHYVNAGRAVMSFVSRQWLMKPIRAKLLKELSGDPTLRKLDADHTIDAVYYNNSFEAAAFYPLFPAKKKIVHVHDMADMFRPAQKKCVLEACASARHVLAASKACGRQLIANGIEESKISVAYNAVHVKAVPFRPPENGVYNIGFVGSAVKRKGFDRFIDIMNALGGVLGKAKVRATIITNSGVNDKFLKKHMARLDPGIARELFSRLPRTEVFEKYGEMQLLLVPSRFDPLPTVILEAAMLGVPVMGSDIDGIPEMLCDDRLLFPADDTVRAVHKAEAWFALPADEQKLAAELVQEHIGRVFTHQAKQKVVLEALTRS